MDFQNALPAVQVLSPHKVNINLKILDKYHYHARCDASAEGFVWGEQVQDTNCARDLRRRFGRQLGLR